MKRIAFFACAAIFLFSWRCLAESDTYQNQIEQMIEKAEELGIYLKSNTLDLAGYDKWFKDFKKLNEQFERDFLITSKQKGSFKAIQEGVYGLSLAWNMLNQAQYAQQEYKEAITLDDVNYAHKWKSTESEQRKKASDTIVRAVGNIKRARTLLEEGN